MCGRYASSRRPEDLVDEFGATESRLDHVLDLSWNVAPTDEVYVVVDRAAGDSAERVERQLRTARWGLVPSWAKDPSIGSRMINARMESVAEKPAFKRAFAKRRCLVPADGYFEWYATEHTVKGKPVKQPYFVRPADGGVLAMAGLYEFWVDKALAEDDPSRWLVSCTIITTDAEDSLGRIHDRMPLMVERDRWADWLDPGRPGATDLLTPATPDLLEAYPVGTGVNNVRNNGPELVEPLPLEEVAG